MKAIKILLLLFLLLLICESFAQTVYELQPGTKGNEIALTLANISQTNAATNVVVTLTKKSSSLKFKSEKEIIEFVMAKTDAKVKFTFDVDRDIPVNLPDGKAVRKDTVEFMITSADGIMMMKQFIFSYVGPKEFKLEQNFPNPFNPTTTIQYQIPKNARVTLKVYDILGSEVATLVNEEQEAGYKEVKFDATNIASGMYIYRLQAGEYASVKKMLMIK